jgi:hypothetical protein
MQAAAQFTIFAPALRQQHASGTQKVKSGPTENVELMSPVCAATWLNFVAVLR